MISSNNRACRLLILLLDLIVIALAFEWAGEMRVFLNPFFHAQISSSQMNYLVPPLGLVLILWIAGSVWTRLYRARRGPFLASTMAEVIEGMLLVLTLTIVTLFFVRDFGGQFSRSFVLLLPMLGVPLMVLNRVIVHESFQAVRRWGFGIERIVLVGMGREVKKLAMNLEKVAIHEFRICGVVTPVPVVRRGALGNPVPILGTMDDLPAIINRERIDRVIAVQSELQTEQVSGLMSICKRMRIPLNLTTKGEDDAWRPIGLMNIGNITLIEMRGLEFTRSQARVKRIFDLILAGSLLLWIFPVLLVLAILVRVTSPGPALYVAPRVGRGGRHFPFLKFRSMVKNADRNRVNLREKNEKKGHLFKIHTDPRITLIGRFMRRFSLDELPQLINVLRGEMSLVGPRPLPAGDLDPDGLSHDFRHWAKERTKVLPGITGLWQIRGRNDLSFEEMIRLDVTYVQNWSLSEDIKIFFRTIPIVLSGRGAC